MVHTHRKHKAKPRRELTRVDRSHPTTPIIRAVGAHYCPHCGERIGEVNNVVETIREIQSHASG